MPMKNHFDYMVHDAVYRPYESPMPFTEGLYMDIKNYIESLERRIEELEKKVENNNNNNKSNVHITIDTPEINSPRVWWDTKSPYTINSPTC